MILQVDASDHSVGAVLAQKDKNGRERVIAYASHKLSPRERLAWNSYEKEGFGAVFGVRKFHEYLAGKKFIIETDCQALQSIKSILNYKKPGGSRLSRWFCFLSEYRFDIRVKSRTKNENSDALSKLETVNAVSEPNTVVSLPSLEDLQTMQQSDTLLSRVIQRLNGVPEKSDDVTEFLAYGGRFFVSPTSGLLMFSDKDHSNVRVVAPRKLRYDIFRHFHNTITHAGRQKTYKLIAERFF